MLERMNVKNTFTYEQFKKLDHRMRECYPGDWIENKMYTVFKRYIIENKKIVETVYIVKIYPDAVNSYYPGQVEKREKYIEHMCAQILQES